jgi:serine/threonine protein kinase
VIRLTDVREAFYHALEAPALERKALLAGLPEAVRLEVASLIAAHESAGSFLDVSGEYSLPPGQAIGPYKILERIGQGGMGVVYRARRDDGEFHREVAIKLVAGRLFGPEAERRFITERSILALLDHPHIVRMIDGGVWQGHRYLVMELVEGEPVTVYASGQKLALRERLELFQTICGAIHYAHQNLIMHRDLKPSNLLVSADGQVKVLDFGIARLLEEEGDQSEATILNPFTLSCASPEQIRGERLTLSTDIYSLGLLLYELLTGSNPQSGTRESIMPRVLEGRIEAPSRISTEVPADLDAVALKALSLDPQTRYASAGELSADIGRFLENRPVLARAPSRLYHLSRFVSRNKALSATVFALVAAILAGSGVSLWEARRAEAERKIAERRFEDARRLSYTVIHEIQPKLERINGTVALRKELIEKTLVYLEALGKDSATSPPLLRELVDSYALLASVSADPGTANVGDIGRAKEIFEKGASLVETLNQLDPNSPETLLAVSHFYRVEARQTGNYKGHEEGADLAQKSLDAAQRLAKISPGTASREEVAAAASTLGGMLAWDHPSEAISQYELAIRIWTELLGQIPGNDGSYKRNIGLMYRDLATSWSDADDLKKSLECGLKALEYDQQLATQDPGSPRTQMALAFDFGVIGQAYARMKQYAPAGENIQESVRLREKVAAANPDDRAARERLAFELNDLAELEMEQGHLDRARGAYLRVVALYSKLSQSGPLVSQSIPRYARANFALARVESRLGAKQEGCGWMQKAVDLDQEYAKGTGSSVLGPEARQEADQTIRSCGAVKTFQ